MTKLEELVFERMLHIGSAGCYLTAFRRIKGYPRHLRRDFVLFSVNIYGVAFA